MTRQISQDWSAGDSIEAARLQNVNQELDNIYENGSDRLAVRATTGLGIEVGKGAYNISGNVGLYAGSTHTLADNIISYVMLTSGGSINISTSGRNANYMRIAKVTTNSGIITAVENRRTDSVGGQLGGGGFKNISSMVYDKFANLTSFVAEGVTYTLTYNAMNQPLTMTNGTNVWTMTYDKHGDLTGTVES